MGSTGAAAVLTPYAGLGLPDAAWAGAAGSAVALAAWRWIDLRALAARPAPPAPRPGRSRRPVPGPAGRRRRTTPGRPRRAGRGAPAVPLPVRVAGHHRRRAWARLDRAALTLAGIAPRLTGLAEPAVLEAAAADRSLRDLADRTASVERALRLAPAEARPRLAEAHRALADQLVSGVTAYERLVVAAAGYVAEDAHPGVVADPSAARLTEATDLLHGVAAALAELRTVGAPLRAPTR